MNSVGVEAAGEGVEKFTTTLDTQVIALNVIAAPLGWGRF